MKGLIGEIEVEARKVRANVSRNSIYRALQDTRAKEERSPLRNYIIDVAEKLLKQQEEIAEAEAA